MKCMMFIILFTSTLIGIIGCSSNGMQRPIDAFPKELESIENGMSVTEFNQNISGRELHHDVSGVDVRLYEYKGYVITFLVEEGKINNLVILPSYVYYRFNAK